MRLKRIPRNAELGVIHQASAGFPRNMNFVPVLFLTGAGSLIFYFAVENLEVFYRSPLIKILGNITAFILLIVAVVLSSLFYLVTGVRSLMDLFAHSLPAGSVLFSTILGLYVIYVFVTAMVYKWSTREYVPFAILLLLFSFFVAVSAVSGYIFAAAG